MYDGVIIGGGLAGLVAGIRAAERGQKLLLVSEGTGSLTYSSGALDIGELEELRRIEKHPYALLPKASVLEGLHYFQVLLPEYRRQEQIPSEILTPLGSRRTAGLAPEGLRADALSRVREIILMAPQGMKDFFSTVVKANLEKEFPQSRVMIYSFQVSAFDSWYQVGKPVNGMEYARFWRTEAGQKELGRLLRELTQGVMGKGTGAVVFPGLTRIFSEPLQKILSLFPYPVVEMTDMSPSFGGQVLYEVLKRKFKELGGEIMVGSGVWKADIEGKSCKQVHVKSKGRDTLLKAREFILATGGIFGGGIEVTPAGAQEKILGIPLFLPSEWTRAQFLGEQPYARLGVEVDSALRPLDPQSGELLFENVRITGRLLAHWDPWVEFCGGGVSIVTGWLAGEFL